MARVRSRAEEAALPSEASERTKTTEPTLLPDEAAAEPYHFDRGMLRELGSCGEYIRKHRALFPPTEYPDGPVINSATCRRYADDFDWTWATSNMLTWLGREQVERVANSRAQQYRPLGPGLSGNPKRYAAAFGYVFATRPELRTERMARLQEEAIENAEQRAQGDLQEVRNSIAVARERIEAYQNDIVRLEAQLPELEEALEATRRRTAARRAERKERELAAAEARLAELRAEAAQLRELADQVEANQADQAGATAAETS